MRNINTDNRFFDSKERRKIKFLAAGLFALLASFILFNQTGHAQETPTPDPKPTANPRIITPTYPTPRTPPVTGVIQGPLGTPRPSIQQNKKRVQNESEFPAEKSIEADPKINIHLKVCEGDISVNGWDRDEVRAYVKNGSEIGFKIRMKNSSGKPLDVNVLGYDPQKNRQLGLDDCLSGEEIQLDVPRGAFVEIGSEKGDINVTAIRKSQIKNLNGDIWLDDISQGAIAQALGDGDVTIENSKGNLNLYSTNGNITVINVKPNDVGDFLKTKTNGGAITLQSVEHSQVESNSTSGMIKLVSNISFGAQFTLNTTNGPMLLIIPSKVSCTIKAIYGDFQTDFLIDNKNIIPSSPKSLTGQIGSGDGSLTLITRSIIQIKKSN